MSKVENNPENPIEQIINEAKEKLGIGNNEVITEEGWEKIINEMNKQLGDNNEAVEDKDDIKD